VHDLAPFLGHFHPVWVHLPIGIFLLLALLEASTLLSRARGLRGLPAVPAALRTLILSAGAAAAAVAALLGWLLARGGEYDPALLHRHQLLGFGAAAGALLLLALHRWRALYLPALAAYLVLLTVTGHAGGTITHGGDYLTAHMPPGLARRLGLAPPPPPAQVAYDQAEVYADVIQPVLNGRCVSCHGPAKANGGLRLDSWAELAKGGKHGPPLKDGEGAPSDFARRLELPEDEKEHMPPRGKPQLSPEDLTLLEWWVTNGYPHDQKVTALNRPAEVEDLLDRRLAGHPPVPVPPRAATLAEAQALAAGAGILIRSISPDGPWLDVNAAPAGGRFGDLDLARLAPIAPAIVWLDLDGTAVTAGGLPALRAMIRLERLHLAGLKVGDDALANLSDLHHLRYLNLNGTLVTDQGLAALQHLTELRALYVWQTKVTAEGVQALGRRLGNPRRLALWQAQRAQLDRQIEADRFTGETGEALRPPVPAPAHP